MSALTVKCFALGDWMTNCYVLHGAGRSCWIVDAGFEPDELVAYVRERSLTPSAIVLTHAHVDHIAGLAQMHRLWRDTPILIHEAELDFLSDPELNLSAYLAQPIVAPRPTAALRHGQTLTLEATTFEVRHTPGHSPGGVTLYQKDAPLALVGDTLFASSIGRHDFPTSNYHDLMRSLHDQLLTLPDPTRVLPGHGSETTIGRERAGNPYLTG